MSTPPAPVATGVEPYQLKTLFEASVAALTGWVISRKHYDDFLDNTDNLQALCFVVGIGRVRYDSDTQSVSRGMPGTKSTYCSTEIKVKLATRNRAADVVSDATKHLQWAGAVLRSAMGTAGNFTVIYRSSGQSQSLNTGQILVSEHILDVRHTLPLE